MLQTVKKIVILGGESTGKSTLCKQLANHFQTQFVAEFAREYLEQRKLPYEQHDLLAIAKGQLKLEQKMAKEAHQFLFCDTDLYVIKVWSEHKYNECDAWILNAIAVQKYEAYIITSPDFPWESDALRENPEPHLRDYFFKQYLEIAQSSQLPFCVVVGNEAERLQTAITFLQKIF